MVAHLLTYVKRKKTKPMQKVMKKKLLLFRLILNITQLSS